MRLAAKETPDEPRPPQASAERNLRRREENREAPAACAAEVAREGLALARFRSFRP